MRAKIINRKHYISLSITIVLLFVGLFFNSPSIALTSENNLTNKSIIEAINKLPLSVMAVNSNIRTANKPIPAGSSEALRNQVLSMRNDLNSKNSIYQKKIKYILFTQLQYEKAFKKDLVLPLIENVDKIYDTLPEDMGLNQERDILSHEDFLKENGIKIIFGEGSLYFIPNFSILLQLDNVPPAWAAWLTLKDREDYYWDDGFFKFGKKGAKEILKVLYSIKELYPNFSEINEVNDRIELYKEITDPNNSLYK